MRCVRRIRRHRKHNSRRLHPQARGDRLALEVETLLRQLPPRRRPYRRHRRLVKPDWQDFVNRFFFQRAIPESVAVTTTRMALPV